MEAGNGATTFSLSGCEKRVTYEDVHLLAYATVSAATDGIAKYLAVYNTRVPQSAHAGKTPGVVSFASLPVNELAS